MFNRRFEYTNLSNLTFIENLYSEYLKDPSRVDPSWQRFFEGMALGSTLQGLQSEGKNSHQVLEKRVFDLIDAYRIYGHLAASFNPIHLRSLTPKEIPELQIEQFGFKPSELSSSFPTLGLLENRQATLSEIIKKIEEIYCGPVGFDYMGIQSLEIERFIQNQIETEREELFHEEKIGLLHQLNISEAFESFIQLKYPGQKRFSIEGGETLIPMMNELVNEGGKEGIDSVVIGMAHRGRLNVLSNVMRKSYATIFHEFETNYVPDSFEGSGDVKYHRGLTADVQTEMGKTIHILLAANPSHLESVNPVVEGQVRALQERKAKGKTDSIVPLLIHGDAAIAGQGVVYETIQLSKIPGYTTGGTIHIVINNQVGFTANPEECRSTFYCTDLAKTFKAPVFHVNAENPESCVLVARLAMRLRQNFSCDVFIDLNCYRKYGHNESDEPNFTQPLTYQMIKGRKNIRDQYHDFLIEEKSLSGRESQEIEEEFKQILEEELSRAKEKVERQPFLKEAKSALPFKEKKTGVPLDRLRELIQQLSSYPDEFHVHRKIGRILKERVRMLEQDPKLPSVDWATAETLAYATLLLEGIHIRLSGQDSGRGTFSHRHAILIDQKTEKRYIPLNHLGERQAEFHVYNSPLSEYAALGFEYGYSLSYEKSLVIWEAQFGDFVNGAQVTVDQYIVSAEQKWGNRSSLALFLPHGYEGMGPEHSSARLERFLQLASNDSIYVVVPSCAAQFFHVLRRQGLLELKRPLILFSPKGLLRFPRSSSPAEVMGEMTCFQEVLDDPSPPPDRASKLLFCTGKVFYDLIQEREKREIQDVAIIRLEQLYPFHEKKAERLIYQYEGFSSCCWVQEEHQNMGAWNYIQPLLQKLLPKKIKLGYVGRDRSASTAAGFTALHKAELAQFLNEAFE